jgi:hypothetical protein
MLSSGSGGLVGSVMLSLGLAVKVGYVAVVWGLIR